MIDPNEFRKLASDAAAWRLKAKTLRGAADSLWDSAAAFFNKLNPGSTATERQDTIDLFAERLHTSQLLYGLATETALKARIIEANAGNITFAEIKNGEGAVIDIRIQRIGVSLGGDGHDLVKLAEAAGAIGDAPNRVYTIESDRNAIQEILAFLTGCVLWSGRYPAPKNANGYYRPKLSVPTRLFGLYMRDYLDPFLDELLPQDGVQA